MKAMLRSLRLLVVALVAVAALAPSQDMVKERLLAPPDPLGYYDRTGKGILLYFDGKFEDAARELKHATHEYPLDGLTWLYLAITLQELKRDREAIDAIQHAARLRTEVAYWFIDYALAQSYLAVGEKENAYKRLETLVYDDLFFRRQQLLDDPVFATLRAEPRFLKIVGKIDTSKMSRTEGWRRDVDFLYEELKRVNPRYHSQPFPAELEARYRKLKADVPKLTDDQVFEGMGFMIAPLNQGHTAVALLPDSKRMPLRAMPLHLHAFPEGVFIVGADAKYADLVGKELVKIEGVPTGAVLQKIEEHSSVENAMRTLWGSTETLATLQVLRGLGVVPEGRDEVRLSLRSRDGKDEEAVVETVGKEPARKLIPPPVVAAPLFLRDVPNKHWFQPMPESDALFVQVNQMSNMKGETLEQFGLKLRKQLMDAPCRNVIVDLRHNNGGTTSLYPELLRTLIRHTTTEGNRLYVIIGRGSYSATSNFITDLERLAKPIFVGEPSSGTGNQDGDESHVELPYSGVHAWLTSAWWQLSTPWDLRRSLVPDIPVQLTAKGYFEGKDPALEVILQDIKRPARPPVPDFP